MNVFLRAARISLTVILISFFVFSVYFFTGKEYLEGIEHHYLGTSNITESQVLELGTHSVFSSLPIFGSYGKITNLEIQENGLVRVDYDFYSNEDYSYLVISEFSYFDTPLVYKVKQIFGVFNLVLLGFMGFIGFCAFILNKYNQKALGVIARKIMNFTWHILHPKYIIKSKQATGKYQPQLKPDINIKLNDAGILCSRTWKYKKGYLYSIGIGQSCWETRTLIANKNPDDDNHTGIYAERLGVVSIEKTDFIKDIVGIVSLKGDWFEHADGVLRAERCDILHLIISEYHRPIAKELSSVYGVPVTVADTPINFYLDWLLKKNGLDCMIHNSRIMGVNHGQ